MRGEHAIANGWYRTARRLLRDVPSTAEHGWLAFQEGAYALELGADTVTARARAAEVGRIAAEIGHADLEFLGLALDGLALVTEGAVAAGMSCLDEVGVAATSGELRDRAATAWSLCYLIYACERVRDFDRAAQWCTRMQEISTRYVFEFGMGVCRAHYGSVLVMRGQFDAAEAELAAAHDALGRSRPLAIVESAVRIAELRRRQGRVDEAEVLFREAFPHPLAVVGLAHVAIDAGDVAEATELLRDLLAATPALSVTQRADALALLTMALADADDTDGAAVCADELARIAEAVATRPLLAMAAHARSAVARACGDLDDARRQLDVAIDLFDRSGLPYEAATARRERAAHTRPRADGTTAAEPSPLDSLSRREREVIALLAEGLTDRQLAERLHISAHTAHRHVANIYAKLGVSSRAAAAALATRARRG